MTDCVTNAYIAQMIGVSAQVIATLISAAGLIFVATQVRQATRSTDLRTLYEFVQQTEDLEARLNDVDESKHRRVVYELLNFLEVTAVACRRRLFGKASGEIAREKLERYPNGLNRLGDSRIS